MDSTILTIQANEQMNTEKIRRDMKFLKINADLSKQTNNKDARRNKSRLLKKECQYEEEFYETALSKNLINNNNAKSIKSLL